MKRICIVILASIALVSCRPDGIEGPSLNDLFGPFSIVTGLQASENTVDFSQGGSVFFTAEISKQVSWKLRIIGQESGAVKVVEGFSSKIDASQYVWDGSTTNLPVFKAEPCTVELSFDGESDTLTTMVTVVQPKENEGFLISDFEFGWIPGWTTFVQSGLDMDFQVKSDSFAPQGDGYFNMQGAVEWDWLIGLVNFHSSAYGGADFFPLGNNPDNVYFNVMIYGEPSLPNSRVLFQFAEDDNENGTFEDGDEDFYGYEIIVDWGGWRLVSISYSGHGRSFRGSKSCKWKRCSRATQIERS